MKFESKFEFGKIVLYETRHRARQNGEVLKTEIFTVVGVSFGMDGSVTYFCRRPDGALMNLLESELVAYQ